MCGLVGIASDNSCIDEVVSGLKSLEYRGYDSSGIATIKKDQIFFEKNVGKISALEKKLNENNIQGNIAIGHTRWATHGRPSEINCHPFIKDNCALAHNGIIENFEELIKIYSLNIKNIHSETDSEIIAEIYNKQLKKYNNIIDVIIDLNNKIKGTYSFVFLIKGTKSIYATRSGSPLVLGLGNNFNSISSDVLGLPENTKNIIFLEENDIVEINESSFSIFDKNGKSITRDTHTHTTKKEYKLKGNYKHFMEKEIYHQPISIEDTILNFLDKKTNSIFIPKSNTEFKEVSHLILTACGTAYHSCMIAKYWFEQFGETSTSIDIASEYRYRKEKFNNKAIGIVVSQSGETMDTLECLKKFKKNNIYTISIINVLNSTIARLSDYILPTLAGPEIGVASTKAFTAQLAVLALLAIHIGNQKNNKFIFNQKHIFNSLFDLHNSLKKILDNSKQFEKIAVSLKEAKSIFYIGRGTMYPLALEGALKLKEITYKHCEGYAAGELKHGPIALVDENVPVIGILPSNNLFEKTASNISEVYARGGKIISITDEEGADKIRDVSSYIFKIEKCSELCQPIILAVPIQLLAYHIAVFKGTDVDQPRNLAKSVTVE